jgi:hypothetical protein
MTEIETAIVIGIEVTDAAATATGTDLGRDTTTTTATTMNDGTGIVAAIVDGVVLRRRR